jgi:penicillin-binding protein 1C
VRPFPAASGDTHRRLVASGFSRKTVRGLAAFGLFFRRLVASGFSRKNYFAAAALVCCAAALWLRVGPLPDGLLDQHAAESTVVTDRHGVPLYEALSGDGTRAVALSADALPETLVHATLAAEDRRFWRHPGVDPIAIARALRANILQGRTAQGASTISQQVAKLLLTRQHPERRRGWRTKVQEAVIALRLEHRFTKRELLAMYLNLAAYGNQFVGAERASRAYFGVPSSMLTPAQAAFLAGLPQRPSGFNPYRNPAAAVARQQVVLSRMERAGWLTTELAREARDERIRFARNANAFRAPHFVEMALSSVHRSVGSSNSSGPSGRLVTTLDAGLQSDVTGIIASHRALLRRHGAGNVAVVVLDNRTGEWLAWEGSGDYFDAERGGAINGPLSPRQPGSALKPFTYALAFEQGRGPSTVLSDIPSSFPTAEPGVVYSPRNYDNQYRGPLLARRALAGSENVPAVVLAAEMGVPDVLRFLQRAGFTTFDRNASHYGLGVTLGNAEVRLDQMVAAFAAFARGGEWIQPSWLAPDVRAPQERRRLVTPRTAFWITDILSDPEAREFAFGRGGSLDFPFPVAVKTGTSQAYHDNWTVGYSRHVTVGVWVGNFDRTPLRNSSGVTGAGPIFQAVMLAAERRFHGGELDLHARPILAPTADTEQREICMLSGLGANPWCPSRGREWVRGGPDLLPCSWHHATDEGLLTIYPPEYAAWARGSSVASASRRTESGPNPGGSVASAFRRTNPAAGVEGAVASAFRRTNPAAGVEGAVASAFRRTDAAGAREPLRIVNPGDGATYSIDPTLRREFQTLPLKVVAATPGPIDWSIGGRAIGTASSDAPLDWPLTPGRHRITARDIRGRTAEVAIVVR